VTETIITRDDRVAGTAAIAAGLFTLARSTDPDHYRLQRAAFVIAGLGEIVTGSVKLSGRTDLQRYVFLTTATAAAALITSSVLERHRA
jgi:hypothetical protein